jgi:hypothetical protein
MFILLLVIVFTISISFHVKDPIFQVPVQNLFFQTNLFFNTRPLLPISHYTPVPM